MARIYGVPKQVGARGPVRSNVKIVGVPEALIKLGLVSKVARVQLGLLTMGAAQHMANQARFYCPVITGNLKSSIKATKLASYSWAVTASSREGDIVEKNKKEYAGFVEFGTSKMGPRFFMKRAYEDTRPLAAAELGMIAHSLERI